MYFVAKRLNVKLAAAYKTCFDVYSARYAAYNGTTGSDITGNSAKKTYDTGYAVVDTTSTGLSQIYEAAKVISDAKEVIYNAKKLTYDTSLTELAAQKLITVQAGKDATAAGLVATAALDTVGDSTKGATKANTAAIADEVAKRLVYTNAKSAWDAQVIVATNAKSAAATVTGAIALLRTASTGASTATGVAAAAAIAKRLIITDAATGKQKLVDDATMAVNVALSKCKVVKWDLYKAALAKAETQRGKDIDTIKALLKARKTAEPAVVKGAGAKGARCEKAMTSGSAGPRRGAMTCTADTDCCGAAKKPDAATGLLMTVEVCWPKTEKKYKYQPARGPMQLTMPATQDDWTFACIEGAQKLVAASAALATAAYMMA